MKTHEMTTEQIEEFIMSGEAQIEEIAVCGKLFNDGSDKAYIEIKGEKIIGMVKTKYGYEVDKVTMVKDTPKQKIMFLAERVKASADALFVESEKMTAFGLEQWR